jgi:hypothetical protein
MSYLTKQRCAKVIQCFYNTYIKADRDRLSGLPIDPISRDIIPKDRQLKLFITTNGIVCRIQYFDIYNLDAWFSARGEPVNPMTNVVFTKKQIAHIRKCYNKLGLKIPEMLEEDYVPPDEEDIIIDEGAIPHILTISRQSSRVLLNYLEKFKLVRLPIHIDCVYQLCTDIKHELFDTLQN